MNHTTGGRPRVRRSAVLGAMAAVAAAAIAAASCSVQTSTSYATGSASSASYRQVTAFVRCVRGHGVPNFAAPPPGGGIVLSSTQNGAPAHAIDACKHLLPRGREITNVTLG
jgi:hypothetical protein